MAWTDRGSNLGADDIFNTRPHTGPGAPPSVLYNGYWDVTLTPTTI